MIVSFIAIALMADSAIAAVPAPKPAAANTEIDPLDKIKCRREIETGSLVKAKKICHTMRQWNRISDDARADTDRLINRRGSSTAGN